MPVIKIYRMAPFIYDVVHICKKYPNFYQSMSDLVKEIKGFTPYLISGESAPAVFASDVNIRVKTFSHQGKMLLIVVNPTGEKRTVQVAVNGKNPRILDYTLTPYEVKTVEFSMR